MKNICFSCGGFGWFKIIHKKDCREVARQKYQAACEAVGKAIADLPEEEQRRALESTAVLYGFVADIHFKRDDPRYKKMIGPPLPPPETLNRSFESKVD